MINNNLLWEEEYKVFQIPKTLAPYPEKPVYDILQIAAINYKNCGLMQSDLFMPYPEVLNHVLRFAKGLQQMGLQKGERVATILPTSIQFFISDYAISRAGLVHIPSSYIEPFENLKQKFEKGKPRALICLDKNLELAAEIIKNTDIEFIILTKLDDYSTKPEKNKPLIDLKNAYWMSDIISSNKDNPQEPEFDVYYDLESIIFTGGTTGLSKGCMLTHKNIYANCVQSNIGFGRAAQLMKGAISVLLGLPFFHSFGHIIMHSMTMNGFNQILIPDSRDTKLMINMIKTYYPILQIGVPAQFLKLVDDDLKGIARLGLSGSAPLPSNIQDKFEKNTGGGILEGYGLSEMSPATHLNTSFFLRIFGGRTPVKMTNLLLGIPVVIPALNKILNFSNKKTTGRVISSFISMLVSLTSDKNNILKIEKRKTVGLPYPDTDIKLLDPLTGKKLSNDEIKSGKRGELCMKGPQRMLGYWPIIGDGIDDEGYIHTGDIVEIDDRGYFYIVDRIKDMVNVSGFKVYTREIDDILMEHDAVKLAATIGICDDEREGSERVAVFIQLKDGKTTDEKKIINYLKKRVAKYAVPKFVKIIDKIPLTAVEKIDKKALRKLAAKKE